MIERTFVSVSAMFLVRWNLLDVEVTFERGSARRKLMQWVTSLSLSRFSGSSNRDIVSTSAFHAGHALSRLTPWME